MYGSCLDHLLFLLKKELLSVESSPPLIIAMGIKKLLAGRRHQAIFWSKLLRLLPLCPIQTPETQAHVFLKSYFYYSAWSYPKFRIRIHQPKSVHALVLLYERQNVFCNLLDRTNCNCSNNTFVEMVVNWKLLWQKCLISGDSNAFGVSCRDWTKI